MLLYRLAQLGLYFLYSMPVEHQMLNTSTCCDFAIPAHITHLISFVGGHVGWPTHWQVNSLIWTMSH
uniref:OK/SW-CL.36 n=1 Tax=Homo sapiens TaxID=9606 RepID=Q8NI66_HUMAN|nr:OK/SW-CL.36 [Homo sapiens]